MGQLPKKENDKKNGEQPSGGGGFRPKAMIIWLIIAIGIVALVHIMSSTQQQKDEQTQPILPTGQAGQGGIGAR